MRSRPRVVVLGGGFAGLTVARELERAAGEHLDLVLVDRHNYFLFAPLLAEAATGAIAPPYAVAPLRRFFRSAVTREAEVAAVDLEARRVAVRPANAFATETEELSYDHLVVALGSVTSFFGLPGVGEHAYTLGSLGDALRIRNRVLEALEQADVETDERKREGLLTFVVAGGSFSGVEIAGTLADFLRHALLDYPGVSRDEVRVVLVEARDRLLPELSPHLGRFALRELRRKRVDVWLATPVAAAAPDGISFAEGETLPTPMLIWAAGVEPAPVVRGLALAKDEKGRLLADESLHAKGRPEVWVAGDCAAIPDGKGGTHPPTGQHAAREGRALARNLLRALQGRPSIAFRYESAGMLVGLGDHSAIAVLRGRAIRGLPAWLLWRLFYLAKVPSRQRKFRVAADLAVHLVAGPDTSEIPLLRAAEAESAQRHAEGSPV